MENGFISLYEVIHSSRNSQKDPHPGIKSRETISVLKTFKHLKEEISSS